MERKFDRREFLRLAGLTGAGLVAGEIGRRFYGGSKVEAAPLVESLPERISWEEHLPFNPSDQGGVNCAIFSAAELMRMHMNKLRGGFQEGVVNQAHDELNSDQVFNPQFISGINNSVAGNTNLIGQALVDYGICRNHIYPNSIEQPDRLAYPSAEQIADASQFKATSFETRLYDETEMGTIIDELKRKLTGGPILMGFPTHTWSLETDNGIVRRLPEGFEFVSNHGCPVFAIDDNFDTRDGDRGAIGLWWNRGIYDVAKAWMPYKYLTEDFANVPNHDWFCYVNTLVLNFDSEPPVTPTPAPELKNKVFIPLVVRNE